MTIAVADLFIIELAKVTNERIANVQIKAQSIDPNINGGNAISVGVNENVTSMINQCTFYNNGIAIRFMTKTGAIEVVNTILSNNSIYGFACSHETARTLHYSDAYSNGSNYVEWCPG